MPGATQRFIGIGAQVDPKLDRRSIARNFRRYTPPGESFFRIGIDHAARAAV